MDVRLCDVVERTSATTTEALRRYASLHCVDWRENADGSVSVFTPWHNDRLGTEGVEESVCRTMGELRAALGY